MVPAGSRDDRLAGSFDVGLHLVDRQLVASDGRLAGKVDDVELTEMGRRLQLTALLTGTAALVPRLGGAALTRRWSELAPALAHRDVPGRIDLALVRHVGSAVELTVGREGVAVRSPEVTGDPLRHRFGDLVGMAVETPSGRLPGRVMDLRVAPYADSGDLVATSLVVGRGRPGSWLGYDRSTQIGPAAVAAVARRLHRHTGELPWDRVRVDWSARLVRSEVEPSDLTSADD